MGLLQIIGSRIKKEEYMFEEHNHCRIYSYTDEIYNEVKEASTRIEKEVFEAIIIILESYLVQ